MDLNRTYKNPKLESRRQQLIQRQAADRALRRNKVQKINPRAQIRAVMRGKASGSLGEAISALPRIKRAIRTSEIAIYESLFAAIVERSRLLDTENHRKYLPAIARLMEFRSEWVRDPSAWRVNTHNPRRQFGSLARHLLARFGVREFFDQVWFADQHAHQRWFAHVAQGGNLRKVSGLPIVMTKMMAHHTMTEAPANITLLQAVRYGQARGLGVPKNIAMALLGSRIGNEFFAEPEESFWTSVMTFFGQHRMIDPAQIGPIIDYLHHQRFVPAPPALVDGVFVPQPPPHAWLSMKGRDPVALVAQVQAWHRGLMRRSKVGDFGWISCGIAGYDRIEGLPGNQRHFRIIELLNTRELFDEGRAMRHCVATYGHSCRHGLKAIYSLKVRSREGEQRLLTVEVMVRNRQIIQARGRFNERCTELDMRILKAWATTARLTFGAYL